LIALITIPSTFIAIVAIHIKSWWPYFSRMLSTFPITPVHFNNFISSIGDRLHFFGSLFISVNIFTLVVVHVLILSFSMIMVYQLSNFIYVNRFLFYHWDILEVVDHIFIGSFDGTCLPWFVGLLVVIFLALLNLTSLYWILVYFFCFIIIAMFILLVSEWSANNSSVFLF